MATDELLTDNELFEINGVHTVHRGDAPAIRFGGWMRPPQGCPFPNVSEFVPFAEEAPIQQDTCFLWEALYRALGDKYPPWNWQLTGSCVNGGYNNCLKIIIGQEIVNRPEAEAYVEPFTLHTYGLSRYLGWGETREGDGSFGMSMVRAGAEGGVSTVDDPEVNQPHICGPAVVYDANIELKWSSVRNHPSGLKERSKKYVIKYVRIRNSSEASEHLRRRHPLTWAGDWGGQSRGVVKGTQFPILTMPKREEWNHQQSCWGEWRNHPELGGDWYYIQNQWWNPGTTKYTRDRDGYILKITTPGIAKPMHGEHPIISHSDWKHPPFPVGGYWVTKADMDYQCKYGEVCAMLAFDGFTGREIGLGGI